MNTHPVNLLMPVFHFLDRMIHEHGDTSNAQVMNN